MTHLQQVDLEVVSTADCRVMHTNPIHDTNICAGIVGGFAGQCAGDSG